MTGLAVWGSDRTPLSHTDGVRGDMVSASKDLKS